MQTGRRAAPAGELTQGHGFPITGRLRALGAGVSLGIDVESTIGADMFAAARMALACQRGLDNAAARLATGSIPGTSSVTAREALSWITIEGARMLGMQDQTGSITPGKQADLTIIRATDLNCGPSTSRSTPWSAEPAQSMSSPS